LTTGRNNFKLVQNLYLKPGKKPHIITSSVYKNPTQRKYFLLSFPTMTRCGDHPMERDARITPDEPHPAPHEEQCS